MTTTIESILSDLAISERELNVFNIFKNEYFLFSVFPFYNLPKSSKKRRLELQTNGIHALTQSEGKILLDSGGFQLYRKNIALDYHDTLELYRQCQFRRDDFGISLDFCPFNTDPASVRKDKLQRTIETYHLMREVNSQIVPVIHGTTKKEFEWSFTQLQYNEPLIAYASNFPLITMNRTHDPTLNSLTVKQQIVERFLVFMKLVKEKHIESRIHVLGATGQNSSHLCWFAGMDQTDSSSWRIKAAYGKISLLGVSEAKVSKTPSSFGVQKWKESHNRLLKECECPICKGLNVEERLSVLGADKSAGFKARCVHNAWTYLIERDLARDMVGTLRYRHYLEDRFKGLWWAKFLDKVKECQNQTEPQMAFRQMNLMEFR
jgi:queuine/archaeosine tRNA-ribosyltransferase